MDEHESLVQVKWDPVIALSDVLECVQKDVVGILVVTEFLLLLGNVHGNLYCLFDISNCPVELESPLRLFRRVVNLSKQVVD